jgi:hypothetical protein
MTPAGPTRNRKQKKYDRIMATRLRIANLAAWGRASGIQVVWLVVLIAGAAIPLSEALLREGWTWVSPVLGFIIVVAAGLERIFSRTTEAALALDQQRRDLSRERRLLIARSGPYANAADPEALYAERAEAAIATYDAAMIEYNRRMAQGPLSGDLGSPGNSPTL